MNEATLANKEVFDEIIKRCSGPGARIILDTNPDHPGHWLKKDYIDKADDDKIIANCFTIFDNDFLDKRYVENLINATPSGVFTERGIYGRWTSGEGAVYIDFNKDIHIVDNPPPAAAVKIYYAGVDWGYSHYGSIVIVAETKSGEMYIVDGHAEQFQEIDFWVEKAQYFQSLYGNMAFYADSARPEHVARFRREKIKTINAKKEVIAGIETVAKAFKSNKLFYVRGMVPRFEDEIYQYKWKENSPKDEPLKEMDDFLDGLRYALHTHHSGKGKANISKKPDWLKN